MVAAAGIGSKAAIIINREIATVATSPTVGAMIENLTPSDLDMEAP
jgi:hypothetical protein